MGIFKNIITQILVVLRFIFSPFIYIYKTLTFPIYRCSIIYGKTGSGKSYYMAKKIRESLFKGRDVNTTLNIDYNYLKAQFLNSKTYKLSKKLGKEIKMGRLYKITSLNDFIFIDNADVFIDEGHRWFFARDWDKLPKYIPAKIYEHRKYSINIFVAVQDVNSIDVLLRRLADEAIKITSLFSFQFIKVYDVKDIDKENKKSKGLSFYFRKPDVFKFYNSFEKNTNFLDIALSNNIKDERVLII